MIERNALLATAALVCAVAATPSAAQVRTFEIPAQPLETAVGILGQQADVQIIAARSVTRGKRSTAVRGSMTVKQALARMLSGTGLVAQSTGAQTFAVVPAAVRPLPVSTKPAPASGRNATPVVPQEIQPAGQVASAPEGEEDIVVTGIRASLRSAQNIKRNSGQIVDSIVAEDIGKLPDVNVAEALQRVSGIQVSRDRGEGGGIAIRGLTQILTTLNGREAFTAGDGRTFNLQDVAAEQVAGIDVYKTPSANLIEGGIGGVIDIRTRKPLDKKGLVVAASARARYSDLVDRVKPMGSLLVSNSWDVGDGELGILVAGAYQERAFATHVLNIGTPVPRTDMIVGETVVAPNGAYQPAVEGVRTRIGIDAIVQYKPTPELEIYAQFDYQDFKSIQAQTGLNILSTGGRPAIPGTAVVADGTNDVQRVSYSDVGFSTFGIARDTYDENRQYAIGAKYDGGSARLSVDASYSKSTHHLFYSEVDLAGVAPRVDQDIATTVPTLKLVGVDLTSIDSYTLGAVTHNQNHYTGELTAIRADASFDIESNFLKSMDFGVRYADRRTYFEPVRFFQTPGGGGQPAASVADLFVANPLHPMFGNSSNIDQDFLVADFTRLSGDFDAVRRQLGLPTAPDVSPLGIFTIKERTLAAYVMDKFAYDGGIRIDGNFGVRIVTTNLMVTGNRAVFTPQPDGSFLQTGFAPVDVDTSYVSVLPSANVRFRFTDKLQLRLAASKVLTRPNFGQLAPTLTLVPAGGAGVSGNPDLRPLKADQLDASLEYYFSPTGSVYAAAFYRKVTDFIQSSVGENEVIDGITYRITRPANGGDGTIKGFEIGGQVFLDFLPGLLSGLGAQGNYTYVDSNTTTSFVGMTAPLAGLSKHSFNLAAIYEKGPVSARIAYNWRDKFLLNINNSGNVLGVYPVYQKAYGWLDASLSVDLTKNVTFTLEGSNLLRTKARTYYAVETRRSNYEQDDIQILAGFRFTF